MSAAAIPGLPDPFRADDPEPSDIPSQVIDIRNSLMTQVGPEYAPYAREGVEAAYRVSQMVPWLNVVVPFTKILPALAEAANGDEDAKRASQLIVNELLKTTQIGSVLYYGYDEVADLANLEPEGQALKVQLYSSVWDLLDPTGLLHNAGKSGLEEV